MVTIPASEAVGSDLFPTWKHSSKVEMLGHVSVNHRLTPPNQGVKNATSECWESWHTQLLNCMKVAHVPITSNVIPHTEVG